MTIHSRTISASEMTTICTPVGRPMRITRRSRRGLMRSARNSSRSGASAWSRRRMNQARNASAQPKAMIDAAAALVTPSCGSPHQPRMKAGVITHDTDVDSTSAYSGVSVSPTPRISWVYRMKTSRPGIASIITRA